MVELSIVVRFRISVPPELYLLCTIIEIIALQGFLRLQDFFRSIALLRGLSFSSGILNIHLILSATNQFRNHCFFAKEVNPPPKVFQKRQFSDF